MATARPPFRADGAIAVLHRICSEAHRPVDQVNEQVPAELAELIDELMAKDPATRPPSAESVANRLTEQLKSFRLGRPRFRRKKKTTRSRVFRVAAAATLLAAAAVAFWLLQIPRPGPQFPHPADNHQVVTWQEPVTTNALTLPPQSAAFAPPRNSGTAASSNQVIDDPIQQEIVGQITELENALAQYERQWATAPHTDAFWDMSDPLTEINQAKQSLMRLENQLNLRSGTKSTREIK